MDKNLFNDLEEQQRFFYKLTDKLSEENKEKVQKGFLLAQNHHRGQARDEGIPYIIHPLRLANYLLGEIDIKDPDIIAAALLHDSIEDTELSIEEVQNEFGNQVAELIRGLTRERPDNETEEQKKINKVNHFKKTFKADYPVRLVKSVDLLDNMRSWPYIPKDHSSQKKFPRWISEAENYSIPLAKTAHDKIAQEMGEILQKVKSNL